MKEERGGNASPWFWLETVIEDIRYGSRLIRRNLLLSSVVVLTLTLGIGMNVSVFTLMNGIALRQGVHKDAASFARVIPRDRAQGRSRPASYAEYLAYAGDSRSFSHLAAWSRSTVALGEDDPSDTAATLVSCNFFAVDGLERASFGRLLLPEDCGAPGQASVAVLSEEVWRARFGADPSLVGRVIHIDKLPFTVVGIAPAQTAGWAKRTGLWLPYTAQPQLEPNRNLFRQSNDLWLSLAGRLAPGYSRRQAQAELSIAAERQDRLHPGLRTAIQRDGWILDPRPGLAAQCLVGFGLDHGSFEPGAHDFLRQRGYSAAVQSGFAPT